MADAEVEEWKAEVRRLCVDNEYLRAALRKLIHVVKTYQRTPSDIPERYMAAARAAISEQGAKSNGI